VTDALVQRLGRLVGARGLADAPQRRGLGVGAGELVPVVDQAARVCPGVGHVLEEDAFGIVPELVKEPVDLVPGDEHEHGLTGPKAFADEGGRAVKEAPPSLVDQRFMPELWVVSD
jgi:hypothetical protein